MLRARALRALLALSVTALVGCGGGSGGGGRSTPVSRQEGPSTTGTATSTAPSSPASSAAAPGAPVLSLEQRHPNGTLLRVQGVSLAAASVSISVEAVNGFTKEVLLNRFGIHVRDDVGNRYGYVKPEQNPTWRSDPAPP